MNRAWLTMALITGVLALSASSTAAWAADGPPGTASPTASTASSAPSAATVAGDQTAAGQATTGQTTDQAGDDIGPIPPDQLRDIQGRAAAYRASLAATQAAPSATNAAAATADGVPFVGSATVWCTYSNAGSPGNYCSGYHPYPAIDIGMSPGTPVIAAGPGQVVALATGCAPAVPTCGGGAGNYVAIAHADGRISRYMHMTSVSVAMGQNLSRGQQLGVSGWTGNVVPDDVSAAHLHYEEDSAATGAAIDPGEMTGCRLGGPYGILASAHAANWQQVLWGTVIVNDNSCGASSITPPPPPPPPPPVGPTPPPWSTVFSFSGATSSRVAAGTNADGRQEIFIVGPFGLLFHSWQLTPNGFWSAWSVLDTGIAFPASSTPTVATNADGRLEVFILGNDHAIWHSYQTAPSVGWPAMTSLGGSLAADPSVARNADGRLELFARDGGGQMWHMWQSAPNMAFAGWSLLGGFWPTNTTMAVPTNRDGRLEAFAVGTDGQIWHAWQGAPNTAFGSFMPLGGSVPGGAALSVTTEADGRLDVFVTNGGGEMWHITQSSPAGGWNDFTSLGKGWSSQPAVYRDRSGRINVVAMGANGQLGILVESAANGGWMSTVFVGGSGQLKPTLNVNADGHVEAYFPGTDQAIYHAWQMAVPT